MSLLRKITRIDRSYANFRRYMEIVDLLARFGFSDLSILLNFNKVRKWGCRVFWNDQQGCEPLIHGRTRPERVRLLLEALGPTFVKLGQILSSRPDLIPLEYVRELTKLQDNVPGFPGEEAQKIIETELGKPVAELFREFSIEPFAAASIGQVHRAVLPDGGKAVVKVQRPGIERKISVDLEIMYNIAVRLENSDLDMASFHPREIVEEFSHVLMREMNYVVESTHNRRFTQDMANQEGIYVPSVYADLTTPRVLVMEQVDGVPAPVVLASAERQKEFDLPLIARLGANAVMAQIFEHGFFHADPHPGNLFLMSGNRLCFIDFGMMGRVTGDERTAFIKALRAMLSEEFGELAECVLKLAKEPDTPPNMLTLERDLTDLVQENLYLPMKQLSLARILEQLMRTMNRHHLILNPDLFVMFKALMTIENVARKFDPDLQIIDILKAEMTKVQWSHLNLRRALHKTGNNLEDWLTLTQKFPPLAEKICRNLANGDLTVRMEHHGLKPLMENIRYSLGMLSCAVIFAALLMSSALIVLSGIPPKWYDIPVLGVCGFLISGVMGIYILLRKMPK